jgi:hypothetical protein
VIFITRRRLSRSPFRPHYALFAFLAGFSERFAHVILGKADLAVSKAGSSSEAQIQTPPTAPATSGSRLAAVELGTADARRLLI